MTRPFVHGLLRAELADVCKAMALPGFRAGQIWTWLYSQRVSDWAEMKNLPSALRASLADQFDITPVTRVKTDGEPSGTRKLLAGLAMGSAWRKC